MKKTVLTVLGALMLAVSVNAQNEPLKNKNGHIILPQKGDYALGFNAVPVFNFIGNAFNGNNGNNSMGQNKFVSAFGGNTIFGKYFLADNAAARIDFGFEVNKSNFKNEVFNDYANSPDSLVIDTYKFSNQRYVLGIGHEWRFGKGRVQGFGGASVYYTYQANTNRAYSYGNAHTNGNASPTSTEWFSNGAVNTASTGPKGERILSEKGGAVNGVGARLFTGIEYFFAPKISVGAEFGWKIGGEITSKSHITTERWDTFNSEKVTKTKTTLGSSSFRAGLDNFGGALYLMFHF